MTESPLPRLEGKRLILGVGGGIAAYKACDLASKLAKEKAQVTAVLTKGARRFVTPFAFEALTGRLCLTRQFKRLEPGRTAYPHIDPALEADLVILAPATANLIARLAAGLAVDLLSTLLLTVRCPVLVCPAMNVQMWEHPATQRNIRTLVGFGHRVLGPAKGDLACGMTGAGRLVEPAEIVETVCRAFAETSPRAVPGFKARERGTRGGRAKKHRGKPKGKGED
ncbi:MAG: hypothetical protein M5U26_10575 [Planctomycetota bacterium]|nr:hypothetical protein [Planctomycetota bacterium]